MTMGSAFFSAPSSPSGPVDFLCDDSFEDACSICLEPFTSIDPPSVTKCKHEYHLHCILEWSQRRNECPVCSQHLILNDPVSQDILSEQCKFNPVNQDNEVNNDSAHMDEQDFEQRIMRRFAGIASKARNISRRRRQISPPICPSQILPSASTANMSNVTQVNSSSMEFDSFFLQSPSNSPGRSSSSELVAFSESLKSKISNASIRYKESISKSTRSLKEKLVARNDSVKELSKGVQREMSAGIAGVARMIERLDITQKRAGASVPLSSCSMGTSNSELITNGNSSVVEVSLAKV